MLIFFGSMAVLTGLGLGMIWVVGSIILACENVVARFKAPEPKRAPESRGEEELAILLWEER